MNENEPHPEDRRCSRQTASLPSSTTDGELAREVGEIGISAEEGASPPISSSLAVAPKEHTINTGATMDGDDTVDVDDGPSTSVQAPVTPVEYGRSKRKRVRSTMLIDFVEPTRKYRKRRTKSNTKTAPENPEDVIEPVVTSSLPSTSPQTVTKHPSSASETIVRQPGCHIPLRFPLQKTAHRDVSMENVPPRKRITRNMATASGGSRVEAGVASPIRESALTANVDSVKKVARNGSGQNKGTEPWKSDAYDGEDEDMNMEMEGDTVNKKGVSNMSARHEIVDNGSGKSSVKNMVPKKAFEQIAAASGETKGRRGRSKRGSNLIGRSLPTRRTSSRSARQVFEQAAASTPAPVAAGSKIVSTLRGDKDAASISAETPRVKRKYRKRGTDTNKDGTLVTRRGINGSSKRLKEKDWQEGGFIANINDADVKSEVDAKNEVEEVVGNGNTVNLLKGEVVSEGESHRRRNRPRTRYSSHGSKVRHSLPLSILSVDSDVETEYASDKVVKERINAMKNYAPPAQQEKLVDMVAHIANLEAHVCKLNKKQAVAAIPRDEIAELLRISGPTKWTARLKVSTDMLFMSIREVVEDTDYDPVKMAEVINDIWPHDDELTNDEPDRIEKEGIRSAVRGLLWDRQARGFRAHKKRKERREEAARENANKNANGNGSNSSMPAARSVATCTGGSEPNSSCDQSAAPSS